MLNHPCVTLLMPPFPTDARPSTSRQALQSESPIASWAEIQPDTVVIDAIKQAEDRSGHLILRAREIDGKDNRVTLRLGGHEWETEFLPFQIRTWRLSTMKAEIPPEETNLLEDPFSD